MFSNLIKTNDTTEGKASRRSLMNRTVPSSISFRSARCLSSISSSIPDTSEASLDASRRSSMASSVPETTERLFGQEDATTGTASLMASEVPQRRSAAGPQTSLSLLARRGSFIDCHSQAEKFVPAGAMPVAPILTRSDSWGCLSVEHLM
jgi:hypothetical protein